MQFGLFGGARTKRSIGLEDSQGYQSFIDYVTEAVMPNLVALGKRGVVFTKHHSVYPTVTRVNARARRRRRSTADRSAA